MHDIDLDLGFIAQRKETSAEIVAGLGRVKPDNTRPYLSCSSHQIVLAGLKCLR